MSTAEIASAGERAVLERVRSQLARVTEPHGLVIGIRTLEPPVWQSEPEQRIDERPVRIAACPSVLAVLDALAGADRAGVTVLLTDQPESELGDAVLARLHRGKLLEADRYTLLGDLLDARTLDPRIRAESWLVDALIALAGAEALPSVTGAAVSRRRAVGLVAAARLGVDPEQQDLPGLVAVFDETAVRSGWRVLGEAERAGLVTHLEELHGRGAGAVATLAQQRDDVLAELLVAAAITAAPASETRAAIALGGFTQSRFPTPRPTPADLTAAGRAAVEHTRRATSARVSQQIRRAEALLDELDAAAVATYSDVLPRGFGERLAHAATSLEAPALTALEAHVEARAQQHRVSRVRAALRLQRWLDTRPTADYRTTGEALAHHARELAWVDRALAQVRAGDADPRVAAVLTRVAAQAGPARTRFDSAFVARLAVAPDTPAESLAVETLLPTVVGPLAHTRGVLLVVVDGMSGAVAGDLAERLTDHRSGWTEIVRSADGGREAVLAALPSETRFSRASLFLAALSVGGQSDERAAFAAHPFWPPGGAVLIHKAGLAPRNGGDLGPELETALAPAEGSPRVIGVVLNAVDDALGKGRQSIDPAWRPQDIPGLPQLLDRAATAGRVVVLTSDHGHVLEHGSQLRNHSGGGARWRPATEPVGPDEVMVAGPRMLSGDGRAVLAATDGLRYGARAYGYHGGATLAEVAIPLLVLLPPGVDVPPGWRQTRGAPEWWTGAAATPASEPAPAPRSAETTKTRKKPSAQGEGLFARPAPAPRPARRSGRGAALLASPIFQAAHAEMPANRVPAPAVFAAVVDALVKAGGRLPSAAVLAAANSPGRNPRGLVTAMGRVLNRDSYAVLTPVDGGRAVALDLALLDEQFPPKRS
ncbi:BREX-2 system phosphatase PglZ [Pseudonocardia asaccharolytica]|uniref:PglZ domain-containing protein n=1 Tax=Pseudonocardia asaccharolytica DSM 44247 = NBRC 16224 TaxID=1123024 RepID=A0A511CXL3_9PSEU|nr:BREX-2 system phosphatase PglZ [Pseudonocardia asaccharolytica]GEL17285.1 hypothetical protein PA7_11220 [Pseudonocardia asaccharolytica DSM 44247 = NBRC 16224]